MNQILQNLINLMELEKIEEGLFRGQNEKLGLTHVFGGQVIGQALYAAKQTVENDRYINSFHSYFLRPGDIHNPIIYDVELIRDGRSFSTRRVKAIQHGKPIFYITASFQTIEEGFDHQDKMPNIPLPDELAAEDDIIEKLKPHLQEPAKSWIFRDMPFEARPVQYFSPQGENPKAPAKRHIWYRARHKMPADPFLHQYLLGYISDLDILPTALQPYGLGFMQADVKIATIDHSMWFHRPFSLDDWLLYTIENSTLSAGRGLVCGKFYTIEGQLVATVMQEGVVRQHREK